MATYLYAIARVDHTGTPPAIEGGCPIRWIQVRELACAVSEVKLRARYEPTQEDLLLHNRVLEQLMGQVPLIPMRIGTIAEHADQVETLLGQGYSLFEETLERIGGKVQFTLDVQWEPAAIQALVGQDERVARLKASLQSKSGAPTVEERLQVGQLVASILNERAPAVREMIVKALRPVSLRHQVIERSNPGWFFSAAFLVEQTRAEAFEQTLKRLGDTGDSQVKITYAGPLPPYNFVELGIALVTEEELTEATQLLELHEPLTIASIKASYRTKALDTHPDRSQDPLHAKQQFERIHQAYQLLLGFARSFTTDEHQPISMAARTPKAPRLVVLSQQMEPAEV